MVLGRREQKNVLKFSCEMSDTFFTHFKKKNYFLDELS